MERLNDYRMKLVLVRCVIALYALNPVTIQAQDGRPVAEAGSSRYAGPDPIVLDGTASYDPDSSGPLSFTWRQISGPSVVIIDGNTPTPMIAGSIQPNPGRDPTPKPQGFPQTDEIQECEFELVVSDGEYDSFPDTVNVIVVPTLTESIMLLENESFDSQKPTIIFFDGYSSGRWPKATTGGGEWRNKANKVASNFSAWEQRANIISFYPYVADDASSDRDTATYYRCADMIIVYLSAVAPDYDEYIQTMGHSLGGMPAIDVARFLNETYEDRRYAINRVTLFDTTVYLDYSHRIRDSLIERTDGEQCWIENYVCTMGWGQAPFYDNIFNVAFDKFDVTPYESGKHGNAVKWYGNSIADPNINLFNNGVVAGAYWSVIGPGKNLQLASTKGAQTYKFKWYGDEKSGYMDFYDEPNHPGRLPEPVTLIGPEDGAIVDANGAVFSCDESENAIGYQLLFGSDPYRVMDYYVVSDTPDPPTQVVTASFFEKTWWTIKARDQYGSTIYADPISVHFKNIDQQPIENITIGKKYYTFRHAINDADYGHEIVVSPGVYQEKINFKGKNLTFRSTDPNDLAVVSKTVITADGDYVVTFSGGEDASCVLAGFTIADSQNGVYCTAASPMIVNCDIVDNLGDGIKLNMGSNPTISKCIIAGNDDSGIAMLNFQSGRTTLFNSPTIVNCTIVNNSEIGISEAMPKVLNSIIYNNSVQIPGSYAVVQYSNIQGSFPGEGNIDVDPSFADLENGDYHLKSQAGRWDSISQIWIQDDVTSPCIDAGDPTSPIGLEPAPNGGRINMGAYGGTSEASKSP